MPSMVCVSSCDCFDISWNYSHFMECSTDTCGLTHESHGTVFRSILFLFLSHVACPVSCLRAEACPGASSDMTDRAYMGPLYLPPEAGYLTPSQKDALLEEFGVSASVRQRPQWGVKALSLSGPVGQLLAAKERCLALLGVTGQQVTATAPPQAMEETRRHAPRSKGAMGRGDKGKGGSSKGKASSKPSGWPHPPEEGLPPGRSASAAAGPAAPLPAWATPSTGYAWTWGPQQTWWHQPYQPYGYVWQQADAAGRDVAEASDTSSSCPSRRRRRSTHQQRVEDHPGLLAFQRQSQQQQQPLRRRWAPQTQLRRTCHIAQANLNRRRNLSLKKKEAPRWKRWRWTRNLPVP